MPSPATHTHTQLYDWLMVNRVAVMDVLKQEDKDKTGVLLTDKFTQALQGIGVPLQSEEFEKLLQVYDKKGEGKLNYEDFFTEQKFIHAVSLSNACVSAYFVCIYHVSKLSCD